MLQSEQINELSKALSQAQNEFPVIPKNQEVEVKKDGRLLYKFKYADLTQIIESTRPALAKNGLSFTQSFDFAFKAFYTKLMHSSGQWQTTGYVPTNITTNMQMKDVAGHVTYGKRLSLSAALGISADEDFDAPPENGETVSKEEIKNNKSKSPPKNKESNFTKTEKKGAFIPADEHHIQTYVLTVGKNKGKEVSQVSEKELEGLVWWIEQKSGNPSKFQNELDVVKTYLNSKKQPDQEMPPPPQFYLDDDIPF